MKEEIITAKIISFKRNIDDLHRPFVTILFEGREKTLNIHAKPLSVITGNNHENWVGKEFPILVKKGRKYNYYYLDFTKWNFLDIKLFELFDLRKVKTDDI